MKEDSYDIQEFLQDFAESSPDKEIRIINAAINIFSEKGFDSTRTKEIAERAGIAEGTIFRYFPTKDSILERMVPLLIRVMMPRISGPIDRIITRHANEPVTEIWQAILIDRIQMVRDNGKFIKSVLPELIHRAPLLNQLKTTIQPMIEQYIERVIEYGIERGELDPALNKQIVLQQLLGFILSYSMLGSNEKKDIERDVHEFVQYVMRGWGMVCKP